MMFLSWLHLGRGTGWRHKVRKWPTSELTGRQHKLVLPADAPDKKVLLLLLLFLEFNNKQFDPRSNYFHYWKIYILCCFSWSFLSVPRICEASQMVWFLCQRGACPSLSCRRRGPVQLSCGPRCWTLRYLGSLTWSVSWLLATTWQRAGQWTRAGPTSPSSCARSAHAGLR